MNHSALNGLFSAYSHILNMHFASAYCTYGIYVNVLIYIVLDATQMYCLLVLLGWCCLVARMAVRFFCCTINLNRNRNHCMALCDCHTCNATCVDHLHNVVMRSTCQQALRTSCNFSQHKSLKSMKLSHL